MSERELSGSIPVGPLIITLPLTHLNESCPSKKKKKIVLLFFRTSSSLFVCVCVSCYHYTEKTIRLLRLTEDGHSFVYCDAANLGMLKEATAAEEVS